MNKQVNQGNNEIESADMLPATPDVIFVNMNDVRRAFDMQKIEDEADACAVRQCVARRAGRAIREQRRASKAVAV